MVKRKVDSKPLLEIKSLQINTFFLSWRGSLVHCQGVCVLPN